MEIKTVFDELIARLIAANDAIGDGYTATPRIIKNLPTMWAGKEDELKERVERLEAQAAAKIKERENH